MPEITLDASVTRTALALPDLDLEVLGTYQIIRDSTGPGGVTWRRQTATSPYVHGRTLVNAVMDVGEASLGIRVIGSNMAVLHSRLMTLLAAFEQYSYDLTVVISGETWRWRCECADYVVGDSGLFQDFHFRSLQQEVRFTIPREPIPLSGPA